MQTQKRSSVVPSDEFCPTVTTFEKPQKHFCYLYTRSGDWIATHDGKTLSVQGYVDDGAIWDRNESGFRHVATGLHIPSETTTNNARFTLNSSVIKIADEQFRSDLSVATVGHGPEKLPSAYLDEMRAQGWVSLTNVLSPEVTDGLQRVGCVDAYEGRKPVRMAPLAQDPAVAESTAEPISLWLTRKYMHTADIRLGHSPGISALTRDDGEREVQGWHTDFPYLWGTGDRIPLPSGDLVLGIQRNICVSDFNRKNGATLFKLGTHASNEAPPESWGISRHTYRKGYRAEYGLPYGGEDSDLIEAPAGTIILYDARTWHRAGMNMTDRRRGAIIQAIIPSYIIPFMDTSGTFKQFLASDAYQNVSDRVRKEIEQLMVHKITGPAGLFAITTDAELTDRVRAQYKQTALRY